MKKLILLFLCFAVGKSVSGQVLSPQETRFNFFEVSLGGGVPVVDNQAFDNWTESNYHSKIPHNIEGVASLFFVGKDYDGGFQGIYSSDVYETYAFYVGRRITPSHSPINSFLNIGFGFSGSSLYGYPPTHYQLSPDEVGQDMYLQYTGTYLSLQSRNYISGLSFNLKGDGRIGLKTGFYVNLNYRPWGAYWKYGYKRQTEETDYDDDGNAYTSTNSSFTGNRVNSVPALANKFMDAGIFVAITFSTLKKHGYYAK